MTLNLNIVPDSQFYWNNHPTYDNAKFNEDVGLDIPMKNNITVPAKSKAYKVDLGFKANQSHGYMLVPRSSISKTPLRLANSIGIIDKNYTGKVLVKIDNISDSDFILESGKCYFQIIAFDGNLPTFNIVENLYTTSRGSGGFGSTTK
tara:strand:+ start:7220 stop:7663 length:444 start_codon:yes stop_codon:yes gene_type:complete